MYARVMTYQNSRDEGMIFLFIQVAVCGVVEDFALF